MSACGISDSLRIQDGVVACAECGSTARVSRGFCLNCMLHRALGCETETTETLKEVLEEIDVRDADWRIGNYQILEEIGRGGMGVIYRARQRHSRRIVALKRILSYQAESQETLVRFRREAEAAASLDHPNILPIYEVSESDDGLPFFSMKFAAGGSLLDVADSLRNDPRRIIALMAKVTRAVQYAHLQGILHRDLKPGNILLDGRGEPLVSDFGLAKWLDTSSDLTRTLTIFGTPGYIAPEQAHAPAKNLTPAADIYSIGAVLFDLFTGRTPFLGEHALAVIKQASEKSAPKLRTLGSLADRDVETICAKCLEREPQARYRSAGDLAEDLERWLEGRPIIARPVSPPTRIWRWSKRNRMLAASIAACLLAVCAAAVWQIQSSHLSAKIREGQLAARSVAVIPFLNLDDTNADYSIATSIAQSLQATLSRFGPVRITSVSYDSPQWAGTGSLDDLNEANRASKSRAILTGTERLVGDNNVKIAVRLMNATTGDVLLRRSVEVAAGISPIQAIDRALAPKIRAILTAKDWSTIAPSARDPGMRNPAAREFIVSGRQLMLRSVVGDIDKLDKSIRCYEQALKLEPGSALAHAYLAAAVGARLHFISDPHLLEQSEKEAKLALLLEPDSPDAHRALAGIFYNTGRLSEALEQAFLSIEAQGPEERVSNLVGMTLQATGQPSRALSWLEMAKHLASLPGDYDPLIGDCWVLLGDDQHAEDAYHRAIDLRPESPDGWVGLCHLRLLQRNLAAARQLCRENSDHFEKYTDPNMKAGQIVAQIEFFARNYDEAEKRYSNLAKNDADGGGIFYGGVTYNSALGRLLELRHDDSAREVLQACLEKEAAAVKAEAQNASAWYRLAAVESCLGKTDAALDHLAAATRAGWTDFRSPLLDPRFDGIATDPRFQQIISTLTHKMAELRRRTGQPTRMAPNGENNSP